MDKYEYKVRSEEIKELIAQKEYAQAAEIADTIDWRRVKSVMMLCTISDLYKINRRYEDSRDLLLLAYDRHPGGRTIVYALCELAIKMGDLPQAVEYCKEFAQVAPKDPGRYILRYKLYEAQGVSLEERIEVLEELKKRDYREKWAYELAYLYHRVGLASKCVDECDEMIVWFGDGKYVIKAMELKMLHQPLTPEQQSKYDSRFAQEEEVYVQEEALPEEAEAESVPEATITWSGAQVEQDEAEEDALAAATRRVPVEEIDIQVKTMDPGQCNTINLQEEVAAGLRELLESKSQNEEITRSIMAPMMETDNINRDAVEKVLESMQTTGVETETEVFFGATGEVGVVSEEAPVTEEILEEVELIQENTEETSEDMQGAQEEISEDMQGASEDVSEAAAEKSVQAAEENADKPVAEEAAAEVVSKEVQKKTILEAQFGELVSDAPESAPKSVEQLAAKEQNKTAVSASTGEKVLEQLRREAMAEPPKEMAKVLSMEADGQISFVMPEREAVEKQITGQISIADVMAEWERRKKALEEKGKEKVRQHVKENTGQMFTEFEASVRDGLLEQLENGRDPESVIAEAEGRLPKDEIPVPPSLMEDDIPVPPSLLEDAEGSIEDFEAVTEQEAQEAVAEVITAEDEVEELAEIEELSEADEAVGVEAAIAAEEISEAVEEVFEEEQPEEAAEVYAEEQSEEAAEVYAEEQPEEAVEAYAEEQPEEAAEAYAEEQSEEAAEVYAEEQSEEAAEVYAEEQPEEAAEAYAEEQPEEAAAEESEDEDAAYEAALMGASDSATEEAVSYETISMEPEAVEETIQREKAKIRNLTREERELFSPFIQGRASKEQLIHAIDNISMASYTGNVIITGAEGMDTLGLAKNIIREIQMTDSNFSGKIAKISGISLNKRDVNNILEGLSNGALIIQKAADMNVKTAENLYKSLQQEHRGIVVVLEGTKKSINAFLQKNEKLQACFTARIDMEALSDAALVAFGKKYAREKEFSIDEFGVLALHQIITDRQTSDHAVTILEVKEIMDEAMYNASKKTVGHFFEVLMAKRYDEEDMIIIREKDFMS